MHLPIVGSIDSFIAAGLIAAAGCPKSWQVRIVAGFAAFDMIGSMAGSEFGIRAQVAPAIAPAIALAALALVGARKYPALFTLVPVLLSVDNLALGANDGGASFWATSFSAALDGLWSGALAVCGFAVVRLAIQLTRRLRFARS